MADEGVQALDAVGQTPGGDAGDLGHLAEPGAAGQVVLVRAAVLRGELGSSPRAAFMSFMTPPPSSRPMAEAAFGQVR